ncbi:hypothetical protein HK100_008309 [Physocladia obscura]|uniref:Uncharacterized protein n=1 Tax=Physocladia obscura TaxID=109957 RepID=A0AAD5TA12_9FUNG|nr:hypothetical protein HK100_008309 [Physocladia obscura]
MNSSLLNSEVVALILSVTAAVLESAVGKLLSILYLSAGRPAVAVGIRLGFAGKSPSASGHPVTMFHMRHMVVAAGAYGLLSAVRLTDTFAAALLARPVVYDPGLGNTNYSLQVGLLSVGKWVTIEPSTQATVNTLGNVALNDSSLSWIYAANQMPQVETVDITGAAYAAPGGQAGAAMYSYLRRASAFDTTSWRLSWPVSARLDLMVTRGASCCSTVSAPESIILGPNLQGSIRHAQFSAYSAPADSARVNLTVTVTQASYTTLASTPLNNEYVCMMASGHLVNCTVGVAALGHGSVEFLGQLAAPPEVVSINALSCSPTLTSMCDSSVDIDAWLRFGAVNDSSSYSQRIEYSASLVAVVDNWVVSGGFDRYTSVDYFELMPAYEPGEQLFWPGTAAGTLVPPAVYITVVILLPLCLVFILVPSAVSENAAYSGCGSAELLMCAGWQTTMFAPGGKVAFVLTDLRDKWVHMSAVASNGYSMAALFREAKANGLKVGRIGCCDPAVNELRVVTGNSE